MADWDERYCQGEHASDAPSPLLIDAVKQIEPGHALDLACGAGRNALFLAGMDWSVTAVDASRAGIELAEKRAAERGIAIDWRIADLERGEFKIDEAAYDLICNFFYLQRDLFPAIRAGVRARGLVTAAIHMIDESPEVKPMNPAFLLQPGELIREFAGWEIIHYHEGRAADGAHKRRTAEIIALNSRESWSRESRRH